jgi:hypothetical protein
MHMGAGVIPIFARKFVRSLGGGRGKDFDSPVDLNVSLAKVAGVQSSLQAFVSDLHGFEVVSIGGNCSSSWYIKQAGKKTASYPFDWIFSSPSIVEDCIRTKFSTFLDKSQYIDSPSVKGVCGHKYYHSNMFNHRDPRKSESDYLYYKRSCFRFMELLERDVDVLFVLTVINDPEKRVRWFEGFDGAFRAPVGDGALLELCNLKRLIREKNRNAKFLLINTNTSADGEFDVVASVDDDFSIGFCSLGESTGVRYVNEFDDFAIRHVLMGLHGVAGK